MRSAAILAGAIAMRCPKVVCALVAVLTMLPMVVPATARAQAPASHAEAVARTRFEEGVSLLRADRLTDALAAFLASRSAFPSAKATTNAAVCLRRLGRYDEAHELLQSLLRDFPQLADEKRVAIEREIAELEMQLGTLVVIGAAPGARVTVDGRDRGPAAERMHLRVPAGEHVLRVEVEGAEPFEVRGVVLAGRSIDAVVRAVPRAAGQVEKSTPQRRLRLELGASAFVAPTFGGDIAAACASGAGCTRSPALGGAGVVRFGVGVSQRVDVGVTAGFLGANEETANRRTTLAPVGLPKQSGTVDDTRKLRSFVGGGWVSVTLGSRFFGELRFGSGAVVGSMGDRRIGSFRPQGGAAYTVGPVGDAPLAAFVFFAPELRAGLRLSERFALTAGIEALALVGVASPAWNATRPIAASTDGTGYFAAETFAGAATFALAPGIAARWDL